MALREQNVGFGADVWVVGSTRRLNITVLGSDGNPKDLTGVTVVDWRLADKTQKEGTPVGLIDKSLGAGVAVVDAPNGGIRVTVDPADTASLIPEDYPHQVDLVDSLGDVEKGTTLGWIRLSGSIQ